MRNAVPFLAEFIGSCAVTVGAALAWSPAGWIVGGGFALLFARGLSS